MTTQQPEGVTWVQLAEYNLADAMRITGANDSTILRWMANGWLTGEDWRLIPDERGPGRHGYRIQAEALARVQQHRGKHCQWAAAQAGQVSPQVAAMLAEQRARIAELEDRAARLSRQLGLTWKHGKAKATELLRAEGITPEVAPDSPPAPPLPPSPSDVADQPVAPPRGIVATPDTVEGPPAAADAQPPEQGERMVTVWGFGGREQVPASEARRLQSAKRTSRGLAGVVGPRTRGRSIVDLVRRPEAQPEGQG